VLRSGSHPAAQRQPGRITRTTHCSGHWQNVQNSSWLYVSGRHKALLLEARGSTYFLDVLEGVVHFEPEALRWL
jgi:hypothetical protein